MTEPVHVAWRAKRLLAQLRRRMAAVLPEGLCPADVDHFFARRGPELLAMIKANLPQRELVNGPGGAAERLEVEENGAVTVAFGTLQRNPPAFIERRRATFSDYDRARRAIQRWTGLRNPRLSTLRPGDRVDLLDRHFDRVATGWVEQTASGRFRVRWAEDGQAHERWFNVDGIGVVSADDRASGGPGLRYLQHHKPLYYGTIYI